MSKISYSHPSEIPVHFFGETQIPSKECLRKKKKYRLVCFMLFHLLESAKSKVERYTVEKSITYNRLSVRLSVAGRNIYEIFEDCFHEWVIKVTGSDDELIDFFIEYIVNILLVSKSMTQISKHS